MDFQQILDSVLNWLTTSGVKIVLGLVVLFFLFKITNLVFGKISKSLKKKKVDLTASVVVTATLRKIVKVILVVTYLGFIGIETSSIIAAVASLGLALGLALQGSLSNIAGGIIVLVLRPFKIGDYIKCENGEEGTVENIDMYSVSAHKIGGLKGTGALSKKKKLQLSPYIWGGGQEHGLKLPQSFGALPQIIGRFTMQCLKR